MILYRITNAKYAKDFSGIGARLYGGRWNSEGYSAVYLASSRSLAILESLVHIVPTNVPDELVLLTIETPDDYAEIDEGSLPPDWKDESKSRILQYIGNSFLQRNEHLLLKVPSVIVPEEYNYLMNPLHPKANKVKIAKTDPFNFDERLLE
ncbi:MAG TPA: RES family NAD+ phosphorylase [Mucilaginibacter sp.]|nr:RES family NAD+ phosphorylase [Mucilaginibacter sp.]